VLLVVVVVPDLQVQASTVEMENFRLSLVFDMPGVELVREVQTVAPPLMAELLVFAPQRQTAVAVAQIALLPVAQVALAVPESL
jgi:hypothetical protein